MTHLETTICLGLVFLIQPISAAEPSRTARQRFVVHVEPTIKVGSWAIPRRPAATAGDVRSPSNTDTSAERFQAALRIEGAGPAGLVVQFEARSTAGPKEHKGKQLDLRIDVDAKDSWTVDSDSRASKTQRTVTQATSKGIGPATFIISGDGASEKEEIVIVTTIISKD